MSGKARFILDTNAIISLLAGNKALATRLGKSGYVGISIISYLEFLAFDGLSDSDRASFNKFCERVEVVSLSKEDSGLISVRNNFRINSAV